MKLEIIKCTTKDVETLREISYKTYDETFRESNTPENMEAYLSMAYELEKMKRELLNKSSEFYFLYADDELAGYLKINQYGAQTEFKEDMGLEVERIYVYRKFHSNNLGSHLMNKAIDRAIELKKSYVWLGVWEHNEKAKKFYLRNGFRFVGKHSFFMGDDEQTDLLMRKDIAVFQK